MNKTRFEAFSDSVFAFAITLLILGIALPAFRSAPSDRELAHALLHLWPNLLAYVMSFAVIGVQREATSLVNPSSLHSSEPTPLCTKNRPAGSYFLFTAASRG